jgi:hypothetical protein
MTGQAWFCYPHDLTDEGADRVLDRVQDCGATGLVLATVYHTARDLSPHSPHGRIRFLRGGVHYYRPDDALYRDCGLEADGVHGLADVDPLATARQATRERGMQLSAWLVLCHSSRLGTAHPDRTRLSAYGDRVLTDLCPAHPDVQAYAAAVARDVARYEPDSVHLEALHHHVLGHGYHHERYLVELDSWAQLALGLCFCGYCMSAAAQLGCDPRAVQAWAVDTVEATLAGSAVPRSWAPDRDELGSQAAGAVSAYLQSRLDTTTAAVRAVAEALRATGVRTVYIDQSGALAGYTDGLPTGPPTPDLAWQLGIDPVQVASLCDEYSVLSYARDPERVASDLACYRQLVPEDTALRVTLRAGAPDCTQAPGTEDELERKITHVRQARAGWLDFYHYGLVSTVAVERAGRAWASTGVAP